MTNTYIENILQQFDSGDAKPGTAGAEIFKLFQTKYSTIEPAIIRSAIVNGLKTLLLSDGITYSTDSFLGTLQVCVLIHSL